MVQPQTQIPLSVQKYFWGDNLQELSWQQHQQYITQTLLEKGDIAAIKWLFLQTDKEQLKNMLPQIKLSRKSSNFWKIYLD